MDNNNMVVRNNNQPAIRKTIVNKGTMQDTAPQILQQPIIKDAAKEAYAWVKYIRKQNEQEAKADNTMLEAESKVLDALIAKYKKCPEKEEQARREEIIKTINQMHDVYKRRTIRKQNRKRDIALAVAGTVTGVVVGAVIGYKVRNVNIVRNWTNKQIA